VLTIDFFFFSPTQTHLGPRLHPSLASHYTISSSARHGCTPLPFKKQKIFTFYKTRRQLSSSTFSASALPSSVKCENHSKRSFHWNAPTSPSPQEIGTRAVAGATRIDIGFKVPSWKPGSQQKEQ